MSDIHDDLRHVRTSTTDESGETRTLLSRQIDDVGQTALGNLRQQAETLNNIESQIAPISEKNAETATKIDQILALMQMSEGHLRSQNAFHTDPNTIAAIVRAEINCCVMPKLENYLDPYRSNQDAQLQEIRKTLDRTIMELGHAAVQAPTVDQCKGCKATKASDSSDSEYQLQNSSVIFDTSSANSDPFIDVDTNAKLLPSRDPQPWIRLWSRTWVFRWPVGALILRISASRLYVSARSGQNWCEAFDSNGRSSKRFAYSVSIDFQPSPALWIRRGFSVNCHNQQDQRGHYQLCPRLATFAIVPNDSRAFQCVKAGDVDGLIALFNAGLAAPTDRTPDLVSLLHVSVHLPVGCLLQLT